MKRESLFGVLIALVPSFSVPAQEVLLQLGTAETTFESRVEIPLTLTSSEPIVGVTAAVGWNQQNATGVDVVIHAVSQLSPGVLVHHAEAREDHMVLAIALDPTLEVLGPGTIHLATLVIECAGVKPAWLTALEVARKGARVEWFGGLPGGTQVEIDSTRVHYDELSIFGVYHLTPLSLERAFQMVCHGVVDAKPLITHQVPLESLEDGLKMMMEGQSVKVAVLP